jgi:presenilin-like A22 family membrane protease
MDANAEIITALSDGFSFHLIYPTIALLHAVKFGLITIESERDQKILRLVALCVMVAITAVFTTLLEVIIPIPDLVLAVVCGLVLATGWERHLIDALEPDEEMKTVSWAWPGNERAMTWGVNLMIGIPFVVKLLLGVVY